MTTLASAIRSHYLTHFDRLPQDKQFHFVSRLSSWTEDEQATALLDKLKPTLVTSDIKQDLHDLITNPPLAKVNAAERRQPYFERYPQLRGYMLALFRVRHLLFHYHIDVRETLLELIPKDTLYELSVRLQNDSEAVAILSTYAINYIYLVEDILYPRDSKIIESFARSVIDISKTYSQTPEDSLLLIYLFTHCIIGASNFYQSPVHDTLYTDMLTMLEKLISEHFDAINLDNKFEFLVCCRLTSFNTNLTDIIDQEAQQSISPEGTFLIDTLNHAGQKNKTSFGDSEHRNVLYIMSQQRFLPTAERA